MRLLHCTRGSPLRNSLAVTMAHTCIPLTAVAKPPALPSPHPSPLHSAGSFSSATSNPSAQLQCKFPQSLQLQYPPAGYPPQTAVAPGYSPGGAPPPSAYLPSGIAAPHSPTPFHPSRLLLPVPQPCANCTNTFERQLGQHTEKESVYMTGQGDMDSSYGNFNYSQQRSAQSPMYRMPDNSLVDSTRGNGFDRNADTSSLAFKPTKQSMPPDQQRKFSSQSGRALTPPSYGSSKGSLGSLRPGESFGKFGSPVLSDHGDDNRQHHPHSIGMATSSSHPAEEQLKNSDASLVEMVTTEILQQTPPVDWSDIAGLEMAKATIKDEVLWPILRPDMFSGMATYLAASSLWTSGHRPDSARPVYGQSAWRSFPPSLVAPHWSQNGLERARRSSRPRSLSLAAGSLQWFSSAM